MPSAEDPAEDLEDHRSGGAVDRVQEDLLGACAQCIQEPLDSRPVPADRSLKRPLVSDLAVGPEQAGVLQLCDERTQLLGRCDVHPLLRAVHDLPDAAVALLNDAVSVDGHCGQGRPLVAGHAAPPTLPTFRLPYWLIWSPRT